MLTGPGLDDIDRRILEVLRRNARTPVATVAREVGLSAAPVSRRIERLERHGVIQGYTAVIDETRAGTLQAFVEVRLSGSTETGELDALLDEVPEAQQAFTIAGDPDVLVHLHVDDVDHLQRVVNRLRREGSLSGTRTLIVLRTWSRSPEITTRR